MLMQIDGTFLFVVISFLIFLFIIKNILFNPMTKVIDERESFYAKNSKMELESKEKTKNLLSEKEEVLKQAKKDASDIIKEVSAAAKEESSQKIKQAKKDATELMEQNKNSLCEEAKNATIAMEEEVNSIVKSIIAKVMPENLSINIDNEKIKKYLNI